MGSIVTCRCSVRSIALVGHLQKFCRAVEALKCRLPCSWTHSARCARACIYWGTERQLSITRLALSVFFNTDQSSTLTTRRKTANMTTAHRPTFDPVCFHSALSPTIQLFY